MANSIPVTLCVSLAEHTQGGGNTRTVVWHMHSDAFCYTLIFRHFHAVRLLLGWWVVGWNRLGDRP